MKSLCQILWWSSWFLVKLILASFDLHTSLIINLFLSQKHLGGERGSSDTVRDPRGFAIKFYTEEGNWDLVGNNTPAIYFSYNLSIFNIRIVFLTDFLHSRPTSISKLHSHAKTKPGYSSSGPGNGWIKFAIYLNVTYKLRCGIFGRCVPKHCIRSCSYSLTVEFRMDFVIWMVELML